MTRSRTRPRAPIRSTSTDTIGFNQYFDLLASARYDRFAADYHQLTVASGAVLDLNHVDNVGSPRAAFEYKPTPEQTYYLSYGTSFDPSAEALTLTTKTANLGPVKAKSYETGAKESLLDGGLLLSAARLPHTKSTMPRPTIRITPPSPSSTAISGLTGWSCRRRGHLTSNWELFAGYSLLDGKTLSSGTAAYVGKELPNVAHNALNLWTEYYLPHGIEIGGGGNWVGPALRRQRRDRAPARLCGLERHGVVQGLAERVTAAERLEPVQPVLLHVAPYYTSVSENHVIPGAGRSAHAVHQREPLKAHAGAHHCRAHGAGSARGVRARLAAPPGPTAG